MAWSQISNPQQYDADLQAIASLSGTTGLLRKTAAGVWELDTSPIGGSGVPDGGTTGQALVKNSSVDGDVIWSDVAPPSIPYSALPSGVMLNAVEVGGTYIRPTSRSDISVVFLGISDPGTIALENDRWDRI